MTLTVALACLAVCGTCLLLALALGIVAIRAHNRMAANHGGGSNQ